MSPLQSREAVATLREEKEHRFRLERELEAMKRSTFSSKKSLSMVAGNKYDMKEEENDERCVGEMLLQDGLKEAFHLRRHAESER